MQPWTQTPKNQRAFVLFNGYQMLKKSISTGRLTEGLRGFKMGWLTNSELRKEIRKQKGLGFPYPVKHRRQKTNIIGDIPLNQLTTRDFEAMKASAPEDIKPLLSTDSEKTYYEIRDIALIKKQIPAHKKEPGLTWYAFFLGDYTLECVYCSNQASAKEQAVKLAIKYNEPVKRVYRQNASGKWKRVNSFF